MSEKSNKEHAMKIDGKALAAEGFSITDPDEFSAWLKKLSHAEFDALVKADGERHYRMLTPAERSTWDAMCGRYH